MELGIPGMEGNVLREHGEQSSAKRIELGISGTDGTASSEHGEQGNAKWMKLGISGMEGTVSSEHGMQGSAQRSEACRPVHGRPVKRFIFDEEIPVDRSKPLESQITNMEYVRLVVLFPYGFKNTTELQTGFALWELGIHEWTKKYNKGLIKKDSKIEVLAYGNEILDMEVNEDNRKMAPFFGIGMVFEECGPSITITSVTNVLAFGIGAITPTPAVATTYERPYRFGDENKGTGCRALINVVFLTLLRTHCAILSRAEVAVVVFIMTVIYLCLGIQGLMTMNVRLDSEKILPRDSELHRPNTLLMNYVWEEHLSPIFLVNNRFNLTNTNLTDQFWDVLKELETLPLCKGPASSHVWLRDFADSLNKSGGLYPYDTKLNPARVKSFLKKDRRHFDMTIRFSNDSDDETVERFLFMVAYTNVTDWDVRIGLMTQWRNVIAKYGTS
ncbi:patched family protein [Teladorsagia circumcincta]|uniref:Patched family protein n=1 Tax=Teladorsagia circumcincta TaxID=45464 RepID=A0A2G9UAG7_TELCI|nr:patched family protein [Teladorsagia circumcincta]